MTFWIILVVLCLLAILFSVWPLWKASHKLSPLVAFVIVFTVALSAGMYDSIGSPNVPSGRSVNANNAAAMDDAIASLQARLAENPLLTTSPLQLMPMKKPWRWRTARLPRQWSTWRSRS